MKGEQLSFLEQMEVEKLKNKDPFIEYNANICYMCCCHRCRLSVEIDPNLKQEECDKVGDRSCWNCDECYYYGMDDNSLSMHVVKFNCDKFEMSDYYTEREAERRRRKFKMI
ncbi:hypothetical protein [Clostridium intestinale]|uniref:hypothetical protein n=1 Tax=Clostridium intestinale TaxID=36845 RepID=UPI002DD66CDE|nr:hypothetical protein [Clostridium intestinale]WRY49492.1 hypothetical protein P8F83_12225 [Clostridium intestinale]